MSGEYYHIYKQDSFGVWHQNTPEAMAYLVSDGTYSCFCADGTFMGSASSPEEALEVYDCIVDSRKFGGEQ